MLDAILAGRPAVGIGFLLNAPIEKSFCLIRGPKLPHPLVQHSSPRSARLVDAKLPLMLLDPDGVEGLPRYLGDYQMSSFYDPGSHERCPFSGDRPTVGAPTGAHGLSTFRLSVSP